jgi:hypothetical protein
VFLDGGNGLLIPSVRPALLEAGGATTVTLLPDAFPEMP